MDPRLLRYYNRELQYVREMGAEFAQQFPKIAGRLGLEGLECADPYVERLLEGFAFMAARIQLKLDAEFPRFTQHLLELVYPHYLAPLPSMAIVNLQPDLLEGSLADGVVVPRGCELRSLLGKDEQTPCTYLTAHDVTLWPLQLTEAEYLVTSGAVAAHGVPRVEGVRSAIRLRLKATAGLTFDQLAVDRLPIYLSGSEELPMQIYEQLLGHTKAIVVQSVNSPPRWSSVIKTSPVRRIGFNDQQALLPCGPRSFQGYRLIHEYFAFPERYLFVELNLKEDYIQIPSVRRCTDAELEIFILLDRPNVSLEHRLNEKNFSLFCAPAINLFSKTSDRIHLTNRNHEYHIIPDRTRPLDFEVYTVTDVKGIGTHAHHTQNFMPFYGTTRSSFDSDHVAYYTVAREPRLLSNRQRQRGARSSYVGSELHLSLVDADEAPFRGDLRQLAVETLCTNRDLPLHMPVGRGKTDFTLVMGAPVKSVKCVSGPTEPKPSIAYGETSWRLISHLSLNYLSLLDGDREQGADALRELLGLYGDLSDAHIRRQIEGIRSVSAQRTTRRLPSPGPITVGRGLKITMQCDEIAFEGTGVFLIGAVLEQFFARYVSINSFTETIVKTDQRGDIMRWPVRIGQRPVL
ncbi:MAG: type VI secretion system baseplate subunit TssF [Gammaproteobacteria bacterium]|nr:type VI secretion system baseplate subunit TssF [Gammaproteobacteria bacterium]